jgi:hypothetical protein
MGGARLNTARARRDADGATRPIRDDDVGVQQRIARPRGPMLKRRRDKALSVDLDDAVTAARAARLTLQVRQRLRHCRLMAFAQHARELGLADPEEDARALRWLRSTAA